VLFRSRLSVHVSGAHVSMGDVLRQNRSKVHVDRATAHLLLTFADVEDVLRQRGEAVAAARFDRSAVTGASVDGETVLLESKSGTLPLKLSGLPFGIRLTSARTTQAGIDVGGEARGLVLRT